MKVTSIRYALFAIRAAGTAPRVIVQTLFPQIMLVGGFGARGAGLVMLAHTAIAILTILGFPRLTRRASLPIVTLMGGLLSAVGVAAVAWQPSLGMLLATFCCIGGVGWGVFSLRAPQEFVNRLSPEHWSTNMNAVARGPMVAAFVVPPLGLWLLHLLDWRSLILGVAAAILLIALLTYPVLRPEERGTGAAAKTAALPPFALPLLLAAAGMFLSGYIAGTFSTHLIILAASTGRGPSELAVWSLAFGLASLLAVGAWTAMLDAGRIVSILDGAAWLCAAAGVATAYAPATSIGLAAAMLWPILSVGLYVESLRYVSAYDGAVATRLTGYFIILHMIAGSVGGYVTGWIADAFGSYAGGFFTLSGLAAVLSLLRLGAGGRARAASLDMLVTRRVENGKPR